MVRESEGKVVCMPDGLTEEGTIRSDRPTDLQRATAIRGPESRSILFIRSKAEREGERREALARTHTRTAHVLFHPLTASVLAAISIAVVVASGGARISVRNLDLTLWGPFIAAPPNGVSESQKERRRDCKTNCSKNKVILCVATDADGGTPLSSPQSNL